MPRHIQLNLRDIDQLFNTIDPSPFKEKDLELLPNFIHQGLTIAGWVAMWRPMEIYLYPWWPIRQQGKIFKKLGEMPIDVRKGFESGAQSIPALPKS